MSRSIKLSELFNSHPYLIGSLNYDALAGDTVITGVSANSQAIRPGFLFVAKKGATKDSRDGHDFIDQAISQGAFAVLVDRHWPERRLRCPVIRAEDSRQALSFLCEGFYSWPSRKLSIIGITGTNGKTSTCFMLYSILKAANFNPVVMGTIGLGVPGQLVSQNLTTMDPEFLSQSMHELVECGYTHVVMEVSSHALVQHRVAALSFAAVAFTNLSQDHLDFHGSMENYCQAKAGLFRAVSSTTSKILPLDHPFDKNLEAGAVLFDPDMPLAWPLPLFGAFHHKNARLAATVAHALKISESDIATGLSSCPPIPGRLELINPKHPRVIVDFAHSPDALATVLKALRPSTTGKLIAVFGCGGDRDMSKRPLMGQVANDLADLIIITDDNPRSENPQLIRDNIIAGLADRKKISQVAGRREAIRKAIEVAHKDDTVLIAGKGHEHYQIIGQERVCFSDQEEARRAVEELCKI